jgi:molybdopterin converting factor small subunit
MRVVQPMRVGELIGMQEVLKDGDVVRLVPVIAGG